MLVPAYLFTGSAHAVRTQVLTLLHEHVCGSEKEGCISCTKIENRRHYQVLWLEPEKGYTLADIEPIFHQIALEGDSHAPYFFVVMHAHLLSINCANSLLKSIEEPPQGYHFIFTAPTALAVIDTIRSRCLITTISASEESLSHPLAHFFTHSTPISAVEFSTHINANSISEREFTLMCEQLLHYWTRSLRTTSDTITIHRCHMLLSLFHQALEYPPMPGSVKIAVRTLFLNYVTSLSSFSHS